MDMVWVAAGFAVLWLTAALAFVFGAELGRRRGRAEAAGRELVPRRFDRDHCTHLTLTPPTDRNRLRRV